MNLRFTTFIYEQYFDGNESILPTFIEPYILLVNSLGDLIFREFLLTHSYISPLIWLKSGNLSNKSIYSLLKIMEKFIDYAINLKGRNFTIDFVNHCGILILKKYLKNNDPLIHEIASHIFLTQISRSEFEGIAQPSFEEEEDFTYESDDEVSQLNNEEEEIS